MQGPGYAWLLALLLLGALPSRAAAKPPDITALQADPGGTWGYKWAVTKTINGGAKDATAEVRLQKGTRGDLRYRIASAREPDPSTFALTAAGSFQIINGNDANPAPPPDNSVKITALAARLVGPDGETQLALTGASCAGGAVLPAAGGAAQCSFAASKFPGGPTARGRIVVTVAFSANTDPPLESEVTSEIEIDFSGIVGKFKTAVLTDTFDYAPVTSLFSGYSNFRREDVLHVLDPATAIPSGGVTIDADEDVREYTMVADNFLVCTWDSGILVTNTAKLAPAGLPALTGAANLRLVVWGCNVPPDVNFQELTSWGAQTFVWDLTNRPQRTAFDAKADDGSVPMRYTLSARANDQSSATAAVSGALFVTNSQPGFMSIALLQVQVGSQSVQPNCALTTPYFGSSTDLSFGGINSGGSTTVLPYFGGGVAPDAYTGYGVSYSRFLIPAYSSARCPFNVTVQNAGIFVQVTANVQWGPGGIYMLSQPVQQQVTLKPPDRFWAVHGCVKLSNQVTSGPLVVTNDFPNQQEVCVQGNTAPWTQPPDVDYAVTASLGDVRAACGNGEIKTYTITNVAKAQPTDGGGSPVSATADVVTVNVECPRVTDDAAPPSDGGVILQSAEPVLTATVGNFQTYVASGSAWTVERFLEPSTLSIRLGEERKTLRYTVRVTKQPVRETVRYVAGEITVRNPGQVDVEVTAVSVTAGSAAVLAACPSAGQPGGALPLALPPGGSLVCGFNVTWNLGAQSGLLGARVDARDGSFTAPEAQVDFTSIQRAAAAGASADVYVDFAVAPPGNATPAAGLAALFERGPGAPPSSEEGARGVVLTTADSAEYVFEVLVGKFEAGAAACGTYFLNDAATAVPKDAPASAARAEGVAAVSVTGCSEWQDAAPGDAAVRAGAVAAAEVSGVAWRAEGAADPAKLRMGYTYAAEVLFTVKIVKEAVTDYEISGTATLGNRNPSEELAVAQVTAAATPTGAGAGAPVIVNVVCGDKGSAFSIPPGSSVDCAYTVKLPSRAPGAMIITLTEASGRQTEGDAAPYTFEGALVRAAPNAPDCAAVTTGTLVGLSHWRPGGALAAPAVEERVCSTITIPVPVTIGPFGDHQCGTFAVAHAVSLAPAAPDAARQSLVTPLEVTVTGCSAAAGAGAAATAGAPAVAILETYPWRVTLTHSADSPLVIQQDVPEKVVFVARADKGPAVRTAQLEGTVTLTPPAEGDLPIKSAEVAIYDGRATYTSAPLDCGAAGAPGAGLVLRAGAPPLACAFRAEGLAPGGGVLLPAVVAEGGATPLPAGAAAYSLEGADKRVSGRCADRGSSLRLLAAGPGGGPAGWQPAVAGRAFGGAACRDGTEHFAAYFGGDAGGAPARPPCGAYLFQGAVTLVPQGGAAVSSEVEFPVRVEGCAAAAPRRRRHARRLMAF